MKVIAIAAVTAGGKTTIVKELEKKKTRTKALYFDDYLFEGEEIRTDMELYLK